MRVGVVPLSTLKIFGFFFFFFGNFYLQRYNPVRDLEEVLEVSNVRKVPGPEGSHFDQVGSLSLPRPLTLFR